MAETDIDVDVFEIEGDDGHSGASSCGQIFDFCLGYEGLGQSFKKVSFPIDEVGTDTDEIDIAAVGPEVEDVAAKWE